MVRPQRRIDAETVRRTADYAGLELDDDRVEIELGRLRDIVASVREWESAKLGFWFDHATGTFGHAPNVYQYRIPWEYPTALTKNRVVENRSD
jgi:hypothetical protein